MLFKKKKIERKFQEKIRENPRQKYFLKMPQKLLIKL